MSELSFARQFLTALDSRPIKLSSDHIADPRQLPSNAAYTIPKYANAAPKRKHGREQSGGGGGPTLTITLKNMKSPSQSLTLDSQPSSLSIFDLKTRYSKESGGGGSTPVDKIKLLYAKKPVPDSKTLKEVLGDEVVGKGKAEFTVMVMAGASAAAAAAASTSLDSEMKDAPELIGSAADVLKSETFWSELKDFLGERIKDQKEVDKLLDLFKGSWQK